MERNNKEVVSVSLDPDLIERINGSKKHESFSSFVNRTLRKALGMAEA